MTMHLSVAMGLLVGFEVMHRMAEGFRLRSSNSADVGGVVMVSKRMQMKLVERAMRRMPLGRAVPVSLSSIVFGRPDCSVFSSASSVRIAG